jgi:hypothetical protein
MLVHNNGLKWRVLCNDYIIIEFCTNLTIAIFLFISQTLFTKILIIMLYYYYNQDPGYLHLRDYKHTFQFSNPRMYAENFIHLCALQRVFLFILLVLSVNALPVVLLSFTPLCYYALKMNMYINRKTIVSIDEIFLFNRIANKCRSFLAN